MNTRHFNTTHGHAPRGNKSLTYRTWESMHRRCYLPSQVGWENYGGKGITVSQPWHKFEVFLTDMGVQPAGLTLERKDSKLGYSAANCIWATRVEQARNKTNTRWLEHNGMKLCLAEWAERVGIKPKTLRARIDDHGWSIERALTVPVHNNKGNKL